MLLVLVAITTVGPKTWLIIAAVAITTTPAHRPRHPRRPRGRSSSATSSPRPRRWASRSWRILTGELLPNVSGPLLVEANLRLTYSIGIIASLAFLGFSTDANAADWGSMIQENRIALSVQPWGVVLPTIAIALLTDRHRPDR